MSEGPALDEHSWQLSQEPQKMLLFLRNSASPSERKLRLWACACVRRVWHVLADERSHTAVEVAERYADGRASLGELQAAYQAARCDAGYAAAYAAHARADEAAWHASDHARLVFAANAPSPALEDREFAAQADLLRDIFGNPFQPVGFGPGRRSPTVLALARTAYEQRRLPSGTLDGTLLLALAAALEEVGCENQEMISHLRQQGAGHVRGCWCVDLLVAKG
jgi:hypothetical protein